MLGTHVYINGPTMGGGGGGGNNSFKKERKQTIPMTFSITVVYMILNSKGDLTSGGLDRAFPPFFP